MKLSSLALLPIVAIIAIIYVSSVQARPSNLPAVQELRQWAQKLKDEIPNDTEITEDEKIWGLKEMDTYLKELDRIEKTYTTLEKQTEEAEKLTRELFERSFERYRPSLE